MIVRVAHLRKVRNEAKVKFQVTTTVERNSMVSLSNHGMGVDAFFRERQIKGWTRRKKEALINGDWDKINRLSIQSRKLVILRQAQDDSNL